MDRQSGGCGCLAARHRFARRAMDVHLLGPVQAFHEGRPVHLGAPKERALLAILALHAPATVPMDALVEGLWGEDPPPTAVKLVQLYVSHLRRALGPDGAAIVTHKHGYALAVAPQAVDSRRFEHLVHGAARDGVDAREALELWDGVPLEDVIDEPFAAVEARRLEALRLQAEELAVESDLAAGRCEEALLDLEDLVL